jgi:sulfoxide reductase heme-binding subunit YedZ
MVAGSRHKKRRVALDWLQPSVVVGSLAPLADLIWLALRRQLGANPVAEALNQLGLVALVLLLASLACTPLRIISGWSWPIRLRRTFGLLGFLYAVLHASTYVGLDQVGDLRAIWKDVTQRTFIFVGFAAVMALIPLALTSTASSIRRLGSRSWKRLHRLAYVAATLGVVHYVLRAKADLREPLLYGGVLGLLFLVRASKSLRERAAARSRGAMRGAA